LYFTILLLQEDPNNLTLGLFYHLHKI